MTITLQNITEDNWIAAIRLKVRPDQTHFVASNAVSLAQSKFQPFWNTKGIYDGDTMVGFTMYGLEESGEEWDGYWICRLMVDQTQQGKGYGRAAMEAILQEIGASGYKGLVYISFEPENTVAEALYRSLGFEDTGKMTDDNTEKIFMLRRE
jgi:diamine N-acetyltransferase